MQVLLDTVRGASRTALVDMRWYSDPGGFSQAGIYRVTKLVPEADEVWGIWECENTEEALQEKYGVKYWWQINRALGIPSTNPHPKFDDLPEVKKKRGRPKKGKKAIKYVEV